MGCLRDWWRSRVGESGKFEGMWHRLEKACTGAKEGASRYIIASFLSDLGVLLVVWCTINLKCIALLGGRSSRNI